MGVFTGFDDPDARPRRYLRPGASTTLARSSVNTEAKAKPVSTRFVDTGGVFSTLDDPAATPGNTYVEGVNDSGSSRWILLLLSGRRI